MEKCVSFRATFEDWLSVVWLDVRLGSGSGGTVYRAMSRKNGSFCAIKKVPNTVPTPQSPALKEIRAMETLEQVSHPCLVFKLAKISFLPHVYSPTSFAFLRIQQTIPSPVHSSLASLFKFTDNDMPELIMEYAWYGSVADILKYTQIRKTIFS